MRVSQTLVILLVAYASALPQQQKTESAPDYVERQNHKHRPSITRPTGTGTTSVGCASTGFLNVAATVEPSSTPSAVSVSDLSSMANSSAPADDQVFLRGVNIGSWLVL